MTLTRWLIVVLGTYALFAVQACVPFPLMFPTTMVTAVVVGGPAGLVYAALTGLLSDALSSGPMGVGLVSSTLSAAFLQRSATTAVRLGLMASILSGVVVAVSAIVQAVEAGAPLDGEQLGLIAGATALWSLPTSVVLSLAAGRPGLLSSREDSGTLSVGNRWSMLTN